MVTPYMIAEPAKAVLRLSKESRPAATTSTPLWSCRAWAVAEEVLRVMARHPSEASQNVSASGSVKSRVN